MLTKTYYLFYDYMTKAVLPNQPFEAVSLLFKSSPVKSSCTALEYFIGLNMV